MHHRVSLLTNTNDRRLIGISNSGITRSYTLSYLIPGGGGANNPYDVQSITDTPASGHPLSGGTSTYTYDMSDRLTAVTSYAGNSSYGYDPVDNATSVTIRTTQTQAQYNQLNEIKNWGTESYSYDANGNLLSGDGTRSYKWDAENRLIEIDYTAGGKSQFTYDGLGRRVEDSETASGGGVTTSYFLWCDDGHLCQVRDSLQNPLRRDLSEGEYFTVSGQKVVYMPDQLGSVRDILDGTAGTLTSAYNYYPYGAINQHYNSGVRLDYRFAVLFYHPASALNLGTYRAQDGVTGRFINRDPIGFWGGINLYEYTRSNPINRIDPLGLCERPTHQQCQAIVDQYRAASTGTFNNMLLTGFGTLVANVGACFESFGGTCIFGAGGSSILGGVTMSDYWNKLNELKNSVQSELSAAGCSPNEVYPDSNPQTMTPNLNNPYQ